MTGAHDGFAPGFRTRTHGAPDLGAYEAIFTGDGVSAVAPTLRRYHGHLLLGEGVAAYCASVTDLRGDYLGRLEGLVTTDASDLSEKLAALVHAAVRKALLSGDFRFGFLDRPVGRKPATGRAERT